MKIKKRYIISGALAVALISAGVSYNMFKNR